MTGRLIRGLALLSLLASAGCAPRLADCARPEVVCVGLVTSTAGAGDHGLNESASQGLRQAQAEGLIQKGDVIESVDSRDYSKNIAAFAGEHYDLIIAGGAGLQDESLLAARSYADILFVGLNQEPPDEPLPNFIPVRFAEDQGGYLAGALAASVTRTSMVGAVCETAGLPSMWRACEGFRMGALSINPEAKVTLAYHDADFNEDLFTDEEWARQAAADLFHQGADVILGAGGRLGQAAVRAAGQAGIWSIGWDQDAFFEVPEAGGSVLASVLPDARSIVPDLVRSLGREGEAGQPIIAPMILSPYHGSERFIPESVQRRLAELASDLRSGAVVTNVPEKRPEGE